MHGTFSQTLLILVLSPVSSANSTSRLFQISQAFLRCFYDSKDICDCFNKYFCTVGEKLSSNIVQPDINFNKYLSPASKESMFCAPTTRLEIEK